MNTLAKPFSKIIALLLITLASVGTANATLMTWSDNYDPTDVLVTTQNPVTFAHNITDTGFRPGIDSIYFASVFISLYDDADVFTGEQVSFNFDGSGWTSSAEVGGTPSWTDLFAFNVSSLLSDGILNVTVKSTTGDFYFAESQLWVIGNRAVPEPVSIAVFGIGLLALGLAMKRSSVRASK